jgi:hypothetical protein
VFAASTLANLVQDTGRPHPAVPATTRLRAPPMTEHTRTDGIPDSLAQDAGPSGTVQVLDKSRPRNEKMASSKIECNACPVLCQISDGRTGACDRYANEGGRLIRVDPVLLLRRTIDAGDQPLVPFAPDAAPDWSGDLLLSDQVFVTGIGSSTTYPDYKPAPFIVGSQVDGVDMVTVVTEGIFSYCSLKVKIDTDRYLGPEQASVRCRAKWSAMSPPPNTARRCCRSAACITSPAAARRKAASPST